MYYRLIAFGALSDAPFDKQWEFYGEWTLQEMQQIESCLKKHLSRYNQHFGHHFTGVWSLEKWAFCAIPFIVRPSSSVSIGAKDINELVTALNLYYQEVFDGLRLG